MEFHPIENVEAFLDDERRWLIALIGGIAGGIAGALGALVPTVGIAQRLAVTGALAVVLGLALVYAVGSLDRRAGS